MLRDTSYRILADGITTSNDTWRTHINNNTLIVGPSGAGKSRGYVQPNILKAEGSIVVTDTKGDLYGKSLSKLISKGYDVQQIDFTDCARSTIGYNPLDFVALDGNDLPNEEQIMTIATSICPIEDTKEPFWDYATQKVIASYIGYAITYLPKEESNLRKVFELSELDTDGRYAKLLAEATINNPDDFAYRQYAVIRAGESADKMIGSIRGLVGEKLSTYRIKGIEKLFTMKKRIDFKSIRHRKTALFVHVSDTDRSKDQLLALFYNQLFNELIADRNTAKESYPIHAILDDFACQARIPDFDNLISVIRSRNIYASLIVQSLAQLTKIYGRSASVITENCDTICYLGGNDVDTARWIGMRVNKPAYAILTMPVDDMLIIQRGKEPIKAHRFMLEDEWSETGITKRETDNNTPQTAFRR